MKKLLLSTLCSFVFCFVISQDLPAGTNGGWIIDPYRSDNFSNGFSTSKWEKNNLWFKVTPDTNPLNKAVFLDENVKVENGFLKIKADRFAQSTPCIDENGNTQTCYFNIGAVKSKFEVGENTFVEVRAKLMDRNTNFSSAIWLSDQPVISKNPNVEIDMVETPLAMQYPNDFSTTIHQWVQGNNYHHYSDYTSYQGSSNIFDDFHKFGLERRDGRITFYFDGQVYWSSDVDDLDAFPQEYRSFISTQNRKLIINVGPANHSYIGNNNFPREFLIDYVNIYTRLHDANTFQLNGGDVVCNNPSTFTIAPSLSTSPNSLFHDWQNYTSNPYFQTSGNIQIDWANSTPPNIIKVKAVNENEPSIGRLTITIDGKSITKEIWGGKPSFSVQLTPSFNYVYASLIPDYKYNFNTHGLNNIVWQKLSSTNGGGGNGSGLSGVFHGPNYNWTVTERITASNACGSRSITQLIASQPCPSQLSIEADSKDTYVLKSIIPCAGLANQVTKENIIIQVFDLNGNMRKEVFKTDIVNLGDLPKGMYIIKAFVEGEIETRQVYVK